MSYIYIPSQDKEALKGYDASLKSRRSKTLLLQYKKVYQYKRVPKLFSPSKQVYRFQLHKNVNNAYSQHNLLVKANRKTNILAGYLVPTFISYRNLYMFSNATSLINESVLITSNFLISDTKSHFINFDDSNAYQHSEESIELSMLKLSKLDTILENVELNYFEVVMLDLFKIIKKQSQTEPHSDTSEILYEIDTIDDNSIYKAINNYIYKNNIIILNIW